MRDNLCYELKRLFIGFPVYVEASSGLVSGILTYADPGGCLVLKTPSSWFIVKDWTTIKRR